MENREYIHFRLEKFRRPKGLKKLKKLKRLKRLRRISQIQNTCWIWRRYYYQKKERVAFYD